MSPETFFLIWRLCLLVTALGAMIALGAAMRKIDGGMSNPGRTLIISHFCFLAATVMGTIVALLSPTNTLGSAQTALGSFAVFMTILSLARFRKEFKEAERLGQHYRKAGWQ